MLQHKVPGYRMLSINVLS